MFCGQLHYFLISSKITKYLIVSYQQSTVMVHPEAVINLVNLGVKLS